MNSLPDNDYLKIQEAAKLLRVSTKTLRRWESAGKLVPTRTSGGHRRYTISQIDEIRKPKNISVFSSKYPEDIITSKIAQIVQSEIKSQFPKDQISTTKDGARETLENLYKISLPSTKKLLLYYFSGIIILIGTYLTLKYNLPGKGIDYLSTKNNKIAQIFGRSQVSPEAGAEIMRNNVLADTTATSAQTFNVYVDTNLKENVFIDKDLEISGGDITSSSTTFNLLNQTVETLNIGGEATSLSIGSSTGTTTVNNNLTVNGTTNDIAGTLNWLTFLEGCTYIVFTM